MKRLLPFIATTLLALAPLHAWPQLRLPSLPSLPTVPSLPNPALPGTGQLTQQVRRDVASVTDLVGLRRQRVADILTQRRELVEADPGGEPIVRHELVLNEPSAALVAAARAEGFTVVRERTLEGLDLRIVTLRAPEGWDTQRALRRIQALDPQAAVDFNHLYLDSGAVGTGDPPSAASTARPTAPAARGSTKIGLIDGGIETDHPALKGAAIHAWGCNSTKVPSAHGTAVASLLVGHAERFVSAAPQASLYAADVYCNDPVGGTVEAVAAALGWLLGEQVPVVNISLVGPPNRLLEAVVKRAASKGMVLVAAVGNDGPASPPLYPAAYADVVAVTGIDAKGVVIPEACRGPHVAFAAPGSQMAVAGPGTSGFTTARGTSFASPLVAGMLAAGMHAPDAAAAKVAIAALASRAIDAGTPGRDVVYGNGIVGRELRTEPSYVMAH
jgi:subtilisin family serine protease